MLWQYAGCLCCSLWAVLVWIPVDTSALPTSDHEPNLQAVLFLPDEAVDYVNDNPIIEMEDGERGIELDDSGPVPACPPAVRPWKQQLCRVQVCRSNSDCNRVNPDRICCYNGCVRACVTRLDPPSFFDWNDNDKKPKAQREGDLDVWGGGLEPATGVEVSIALTLPGQCPWLSQQQFDALEQFKSSASIKSCFCRDGNVFCEVLDVTAGHQNVKVIEPIKFS